MGFQRSCGPLLGRADPTGDLPRQPVGCHLSRLMSRLSVIDDPAGLDAALFEALQRDDDARSADVYLCTEPLLLCLTFARRRDRRRAPRVTGTAVRRDRIGRRTVETWRQKPRS